jgi:hypothetical protein
LVQELFRGGGTQTDRQNGDLIRLTFLFKESRLKDEKRREADKTNTHKETTENIRAM